MEQISKVRKCYRCGVTLQSDDSSKEGYVNPEVLENPNQNFLFCQKCFEADRFHSLSNEPYIEEDFIKVLKIAKETNSLLVYVANLLSFETSFSKEVIELIQGMKILVVGTKFDLLPSTVNRDEIAEYVAHRFRVAGLKITHNDVIITSLNNEESTREVLTRIFELKNAKDVYVVGSTNAGKTALISEFLKVYNNLSNGNIVTHFYKDTKVKVMEIPLTKNSSMYETPGLSITNSVLFDLDQRTFKDIYITKRIEPRYESITEGHSLFIGGLAVIEMISGDKTDIACFFNRNISLHKNHFRNVESKFLKLIKANDLRPCLSKINSVKDMEVFDIEFNNDSKSYRDLGFSGIGWVSIKASNQKLRVYLPKGVSLYTSRPKVKVE